MPEAPSVSGRVFYGRKKLYFWALLTAFAAFAVYLPSLQNGFVDWDDQRYIYDNPFLRTLDLSYIIWAFTSAYASNWHPLTMISYAIDYSIWGAAPLGYHLTNNILHAVDTFLVFILTVRLFESSGVKKPEGADKRAFVAASAAALLFGLHPLHVESVAWVSERKDVLSGLFFLLSIRAYVEYASSSFKKHYIASLAFFLLALLAKPMAVTLPAVLLILDWYPIRRWKDRGGLRKALLEKTPFLILSGLSALATVLAQRSGGAIRSLETHPVPMRIFLSVKALVFYLYKMVLPLDLAPYYLPPVDMTLFGVPFAVFTAILAATAALSILAMRKGNRIFLAALLYYVITLLPVIGIVQVGGQAAADRYTYLPSLSPFILLGAAAGLLYERLGKKALLAVPAALLLFGVLTLLTIRQQAVWKDAITLWTYEITKFPQRTYGYKNRGLAYQDMGEFARSIMDFTKAIELDPGFSDFYNNRGLAYYELKEYEKAREDFTKAIALDPGYKAPYDNRALTYMESGEFAKAIEDYTRAIEISPRAAGSYIDRGVAYGKTGQYKRAIADFNAALEIMPDNPAALLNRGIAHFTSGNLKDAGEDLKKAASLNSGDALTHYYLGQTLSSLGNDEGAERHLKKARELGLKPQD